jgi:hypothetical protein
MNNGFGDSLTTSTGGMAVFGGYLYVGAGNTAEGAQLWRTNDGASWAQVIGPGFGDPNNQKAETVFVFQNQLYASVKNAVTGMELWRSADGTAWEQANADGFGDSNNSGTNGSNATGDFLSQLYVGTSNVVDGGELWRMLPQVIDTPTATQTSTNTPTNTPTNTATDTPTFTSTNTPTYTPTNTPAATHTPTNTATNTPTDTPTNTPTYTPTNTPTNTPTSTPTPLSNTPGKVTGGGNMNLPAGKVTFGFVVRYSNGALAPSGNLTFKDHGSNISLKATSFKLLNISGRLALITGYGTVNRQPNMEFTVVVVDGRAPGSSDTFIIQIPALNRYSAGGILRGGSILISRR